MFVHRTSRPGAGILDCRRLHARLVCAHKQKLCAPKQAAFGHVAYEQEKINEIGGKRSLASGQTSRRTVRRAASMAVPVSSILPPTITTRFTRPVVEIADIEALERLPYDSLLPARNLHHLFEATARLHPERPALTVLTKGSREAGDVTLTHRQLLAEISRAANLFRLNGVRESGGTVAFLCPILPPLF